MRPFIFVCLFSGAMVGQTAGQRWHLKYFYDEDQSSLQVRDLAFPSEKTGFAVGVEFGGEHRRPKPATLVTGDGGNTWKLVTTPEFGVSLFFLNDHTGWMVTDKGLTKWSGGESWQKVKSPKGLLRVYFLDENRGFGVGLEKGAWETSDGGKEWKMIPQAAKTETKAQHTAFGWIDFTEQIGVIAGWSRPPRISRDLVPDWVDPEQAQQRREWPTSTILLQTRDGGKTWSQSVTSMFGRLTRVRRAPRPSYVGLALVQFDEQLQYPAEAYRLDPATGATERVYRDKTHGLTDIAMTRSGRAYLAGCAKTGSVQQLPIPGKMIVLESDNLKDFKEMEVDYRAVCNNVVLSSTPQGSIWAATDTGMLLKLE